MQPRYHIGFLTHEASRYQQGLSGQLQKAHCRKIGAIRALPFEVQPRALLQQWFYGPPMLRQSRCNPFHKREVKAYARAKPKQCRGEQQLVNFGTEREEEARRLHI